jgi:polysaccharide biosynthesis/export protein
MGDLWNALPTSGWERLAADAAWQSTAIVTCGLILAWLARRHAALRAAVLLSVAALSVAVPLLSGAVRLGGGGLLAPPGRIVDQPTVDARSPVAHRVDRADETGISATRSFVAIKIVQPIRWQFWLAGCWLVASGCLAFRLARGAFIVRHWIRTATPCHDPSVEAALSRAAAAIGVRPPEVLWTTVLDSPALVGLGQPRLLLPFEMPEGVDWFVIFCHELAHRARRDRLSRLIVELAVTALPWQPLLWLARGKFRAACEEACDDWTVAAGADPVEFAALLVELVPQRRPALALGMAENRAAVRQRILRLLAMTRAGRPRLGLLLCAAGGLASVAVAVVLALLQYNSGPRPIGDLPPWGDMPVADAIAQGKRDWAQANDRWPTGAHQVPTEKDKSTLPTYIINPPDILMIDAIKPVPKSPYQIERGDRLDVEIRRADGGSLNGQFVVDLEGQLSLGAAYGSIQVAGLTLPEARDALKQHLAKTMSESQILLTLSFEPIARQISGEHLVSPDGTINLGTYGAVSVTGLTIAEAKAAIESQLALYLEAPKVSVDIFAYNSQVYYVITEGAGIDDTLVRLPITGNETVLDALAQLNGLSRLSQKNIWIARPMPGDLNRDAILPVSFEQVAKGVAAATATNYQVLPGDRIFVAEKITSRGFVSTMLGAFFRSVSTADLPEPDSPDEVSGEEGPTMHHSPIERAR